jgi:hypothetical protein
MMRHYLRRLGSILAAALLIAGILLVRDGMTHSTATNSFAIFAGSALAATGLIGLCSLDPPKNKSRPASSRHFEQSS